MCVGWSLQLNQVMCRWICCTSFFADVAQVSLPPCCLLMKKKVGSTVPPCILHYCQRAENLPAAGNWIHASGLDLDKDVPPSPNPFIGVWWAQMNGPGGGTHRRASRFSTDKHCSLLSSSSLLQLTYVSWVFLLSSATLSHFPYVFAALLWSFLVSVPVSKHSSSSSPLTLWLVSLSFLTPPGHQPQVSIQQVSLLQS